ncbi:MULTISPECIES: ATP-binding protein [Methylomonas]|uniref:ATP-binding protein n=1 Tax=Methylomonas koyamae TaxID=702114 RepID=A0A177N4I7_9GAMM|nr:ATP-binding protein [Methylomonas koyamae]OAI12765.1 hypothetical protein A1355_14090 [Methylomonas koyamae]
MNAPIQLRVNTTKLVHSLRWSFTNQETYLGELMQNARRAGASYVAFDYCAETDTVTVTDDGCGIDSIETLLTVAESGWDVETIAKEHAFGVGFLSALFACRHLDLSSKGGRFSADTDHILGFQPVAVSPVTDWNGLTEITLIEIDGKHIDTTLAKLAAGFPIAVHFNGTVLPRPHALDSAGETEFVDSAIGRIRLIDLRDSDRHFNDCLVYLQGLPVYQGPYYRFCGTRYLGNIVHLDSEQFMARLPDRDKLVDETKVIHRVGEAIRTAIECKLETLKAALSADQFLSYYPALRECNLLRLLNDVEVLPTPLVSRIERPPVCDAKLFGDFEETVDQLVTKQAVETGQVQLVTIDDDITTEGVLRYLMAWKNGWLLVNNQFDAGHWVQPYLRHLSQEDVYCEIIDELHRAQFKGIWVWVTAVFCRAYRIRIGADIVEYAAYGAYIGCEQDDVVIIPCHEKWGNVLEQVSRFCENDEYQGACHDDDIEQFGQFVIANTAENPAEALSRLMPDLGAFKGLHGKRFVLDIDHTGQIASLVMAEDEHG